MSSRFTLAAGLLVMSALCVGQTITGRISGFVKDSTGAVVPGVRVTVVQMESGLSRALTSNDQGFYVIDQLQPGEYEVRAETAGFRIVASRGHRLVADGRLTVDFVLEVGDVSQAITIEESIGEAVNTVSGEIARVIDREQVQNLALNGRNYMQLVSLVPGAVLLDADQMALTTGLQTTTQTINGNRANTSNLSVDGAFNMDSGSNSSQVNNVGIDFIHEVKVQTSNFSAEYGRNSGASINVTTRGGSSSFHGSMFHFLRNEQLDARNTFSPLKGPLRFNNFGWSIGGPVKRDKLFFFAGQEFKIIRRTTDPVRRTFPTLAERRGNFSSRAGAVNSPGTTTPFPGNVLPASMIAPDGAALMRVYDRMQGLAASYADSPSANNTIFQMRNPYDGRQDIFRLDWRANERHHLFGRYIHDEYDLIDPFGTFGDGQLPLIPTNRRRPGTSYMVSDVWTIAPTLVNEVRVAGVWHGQRIPPVGDTWLRSTYGFQYPFIFGGGRYPDGIPGVTIAGFTGWRGPGFVLFSPTTDISVTNNLTKVYGTHVLKGGVLFARNRQDRNPGGTSQYTGRANFQPGGNPRTTGNAVADALLSNYRTYEESSADPMAFFRFNQFEAFVSDNWRVMPTLSLEIGVRYYRVSPTYSQQNNLANFVPALYNPAAAVSVNRNGTLVPGSGNIFNGLVRAGDEIPSDQLGRVPGATSPEIAAVPTGAPRGLYNLANTLAPRFSFAWAPKRLNRTSIRGGFGMFFDKPEGNTIASLMNVPPFIKVVQLENGNLSSGAGSAASLPFGPIFSVNQDLQIPYTMSYSLSVQREWLGAIFSEVAYVANLGRNLLSRPDVNQPAFDDLVANAILPAAQRAAVNFLRPYRGFSEIRMSLSESTSNYHSLQVHVSRRSGSFLFTGNYTFSKVLTDASGNAAAPEDPTNRKYNYGPASFDRPHVLVGTFTWQAPSLAGQSVAIRAIAGGWELSGITRYQSGSPLTIISNTATGTRRADYVGGAAALPAGDRTTARWFNTAAFTPPANDQRGTSGVGILRAPSMRFLDLSLRKNFQIHEKWNLRFQVDAFNSLNNANYTNVVSNISNVNAASVTAAGPARNIQLGLRISF